MHIQICISSKSEVLSSPYDTATRGAGLEIILRECDTDNLYL